MAVIPIVQYFVPLPAKLHLILFDATSSNYECHFEALPYWRPMTVSVLGINCKLISLFFQMS